MGYESPHFPTGEEGDRLRALADMHTLVSMTAEEIQRFVEEAGLTAEDAHTIEELREWAATRGGQANA